MLFDVVNSNSTVQPTVFLDWGRYDPQRPVNGTDVPKFSRTVRDLLNHNGYTVHWREWNDGSEIDLWSARMEEIFATFFPAGDNQEKKAP